MSTFMTDCELLERAAKAAGLRYTKPYAGYSGALGLALEDSVGRYISDWGPLTNDRDALRLAVQLGLRVKVVKDDHAEVDSGDDNSPLCWQAVTNARDIYAATRRAIVRAAVEISQATGETP